MIQKCFGLLFLCLAIIGCKDPINNSVPEPATNNVEIDDKSKVEINKIDIKENSDVKSLEDLKKELNLINQQIKKNVVSEKRTILVNRIKALKDELKTSTNKEILKEEIEKIYSKVNKYDEESGLRKLQKEKKSLMKQIKAFKAT